MRLVRLGTGRIEARELTEIDDTNVAAFVEAFVTFGDHNLAGVQITKDFDELVVEDAQANRHIANGSHTGHLGL